MTRLDTLSETLSRVLPDQVVASRVQAGELTIELRAADLVAACTLLRDHPDLRFEQLMDVCGMDYSTYGDSTWTGARFAVVVHLLSLTHNWRLRVRVFAADDVFPLLPSMVEIWPSANWFEREAFDLFGLMFEGHPDLRRLLTDYGFVGHPFRKDFPVIGNVEMRYDPEQQRVVYQPVSIDERNNVPRVIREEGFHRG